MKTKLVLWGTNEKDERVLIALELRPNDNKVNLFVFPENITGDNFDKKLMDEWRLGKEVEFPEGHTVAERELSASESLLPENLKVERGDIIQRAQTEWHFVVLSAKLNDVYNAELADIKEKIEGLTAYDSKHWESLKSFWNKVQGQMKERNLFREHANSLRDTTNKLFDKMKKLRASLDEEFQSQSKEGAERFMTALGSIEKKIVDGLNLQGVFNDLKNIQREFKESKLTRDHRSKIWDRLDKAFKEVKEKRFGPQTSQDNSPSDRLKRRYEGLLSAIEKMSRSIKRDKGDLEYQDRKIENSEGQLEAQIRQAKTKMIIERIRSKEEKLAEMMQTKTDLENRIASQEKKDKAAAEKAKIKEAQIEAKAKAKEKIAAKIEEKKAAREGDSETLEKAAEALKAKAAPKSKPADESLLSGVGTAMGEALEDVIDTVRAVAEVVSDKVEDAIDDLKEAVEEGRKEMADKKAAKAKPEPKAKPETKPEVEPKAKAPATTPDDLKKIEGIGPKIAEVINSGGITTFAQLAAASADAVKEILNKAEGNFAAHDPGTWPAQAKMAANGAWDKLKKWQDELDGGKVVAAKNEEE